MKGWHQIFFHAEGNVIEVHQIVRVRSTDSGDALALAANEVACCLGPLLFQPEIRGKQGVRNVVVVRAVRCPS